MFFHRFGFNVLHWKISLEYALQRIISDENAYLSDKMREIIH